jgi:hypothetical protein
VIGLTDDTEGPLISEYSGNGIGLLPFNITNSFAWAAEPGIEGPSLPVLFAVGTNTAVPQDLRKVLGWRFGPATRQG